MKLLNLLLLLMAITLFNSCDVQKDEENIEVDQDWIKIKLPTERYANGMYINPYNNRLFIYTDKLYYSDNNGQSWVNTPVNTEANWVATMAFATSQDGVLFTSKGEMFVTQNKGANWTRASYSYDNKETYPRSLDYSDSLNGIAVGYPGLVMTSDAIFNWIKIDSLPPTTDLYEYKKVLFVDHNNAIAYRNANLDGFTIHYSNNKGKTWEKTKLPRQDSSVYNYGDLAVLDTNKVVCLVNDFKVDSLKLFLSEDKGKFWRIINTFDTGWSFHLACKAPSTIAFTAQSRYSSKNHVYISEDAGANWNIISRQNVIYDFIAFNKEGYLFVNDMYKVLNRSRKIYK